MVFYAITDKAFKVTVSFDTIHHYDETLSLAGAVEHNVKHLQDLLLNLFGVLLL